MKVQDFCKKAKEASYILSSLSREQKDNALKEIKNQLILQKDDILSANLLDLKLAKDNKKPDSFLDRLKLTLFRYNSMLDGLDAVCLLSDPVGETVEDYYLDNGLNIKKVRAPLGVIGIIYEARPNVTIDALALTLKSGNSVVLRGSRDAQNTNKALVSAAKAGLKEASIDDNAIIFLEGESRETTKEMLQQAKYIDVVIPRGGETLKNFVLENACMPVIASAGGNCHAYIEKSADLIKAKSIIFNAKTQRPSVCNALETILIDREIAKDFLLPIADELIAANVLLKGDRNVLEVLPQATLIDDNEYFTEYNDLIIKIKIVKDIEEAITHINLYGTNHSEAIISEDKIKQSRFCSAVDSAAVYVNASTRFTDGFEFGLGAEMGISTQKLHVRGPIGLKELTSLKYVILGNGHIRGWFLKSKLF